MLEEIWGILEPRWKVGDQCPQLLNIICVSNQRDFVKLVYLLKSCDGRTVFIW